MCERTHSRIARRWVKANAKPKQSRRKIARDEGAKRLQDAQRYMKVLMQEEIGVSPVQEGHRERVFDQKEGSEGINAVEFVSVDSEFDQIVGDVEKWVGWEGVPADLRTGENQLKTYVCGMCYGVCEICYACVCVCVCVCVCLGVHEYIHTCTHIRDSLQA